MTDYRATPDQWTYQERWAVEDSESACLLELRARIEALEASTYKWRCDHLRLANTCASMSPDRSKFFADLMPDGDAFETAPMPAPTFETRPTTRVELRLPQELAQLLDQTAASHNATRSAIARAAIRAGLPQLATLAANSSAGLTSSNHPEKPDSSLESSQ
jgi:predicted DNA-binding protein